MCVCVCYTIACNCVCYTIVGVCLPYAIQLWVFVCATPLCILSNCVCLCVLHNCACYAIVCACVCYAIGAQVIDPGLRLNRPTDPHTALPLVIVITIINRPTALCGYPLLKLEIRDSCQISTTSAIFFHYNYFRQIIWRLASVQFHF